MRIEVKVPQLPESVAEATLVNWHKKPGDAVKRDENLIDVETDKVVLELPAPSDGVLTEITRPDGSTVTSNDVIAVIDTDAKAGAAKAEGAKAEATPPQPAAAKPEATPSQPAAAPKPPSPGQSAAQPAPAAARQAPAAAATATGGNGATAMPAARKMMADQGVEPASVQGTGRGGRITKGDVIAAAEAKAAAAQSAQSAAPPAPTAKPAAPAAKPPAQAPGVQLPAALGSRPEQRVPMSRLRQRVAERLVQSQSTAAILTTFNEVNMQPVIDLRNRYKERFETEHGVKLGFMGFFV